MCNSSEKPGNGGRFHSAKEWKMYLSFPVSCGNRFLRKKPKGSLLMETDGSPFRPFSSFYTLTVKCLAFLLLFSTLLLPFHYSSAPSNLLLPSSAVFISSPIIPPLISTTLLFDFLQSVRCNPSFPTPSSVSSHTSSSPSFMSEHWSRHHTHEGDVTHPSNTL